MQVATGACGSFITLGWDLVQYPVWSHFTVDVLGGGGGVTKFVKMISEIQFWTGLTQLEVQYKNSKYLRQRYFDLKCQVATNLYIRIILAVIYVIRPWQKQTDSDTNRKHDFNSNTAHTQISNNMAPFSLFPHTDYFSQWPYITAPPNMDPLLLSVLLPLLILIIIKSIAPDKITMSHLDGLTLMITKSQKILFWIQLYTDNPTFDMKREAVSFTV